jgi:hypothetical protein
MKTDDQLFDQSGGASSGGKQDVINSAAGTIIKLMLKSQMSGVSLTPPLFPPTRSKRLMVR